MRENIRWCRRGCCDAAQRWCRDRDRCSSHAERRVSFTEDIPTITFIDCGELSYFTYSVTGTATGPYPETFTETGMLIF